MAITLCPLLSLYSTPGSNHYLPLHTCPTLPSPTYSHYSQPLRGSPLLPSFLTLLSNHYHPLHVWPTLLVLSHCSTPANTNPLSCSRPVAVLLLPRQPTILVLSRCSTSTLAQPSLMATVCCTCMQYYQPSSFATGMLPTSLSITINPRGVTSVVSIHPGLIEVYHGKWRAT